MGPNLYIIAGANGVGKTTFAREFLPNYADCRNFVNADLIAEGLSPLSPEAAAFHAGRLMLDEIYSLAGRRADFGFESTLSGRSHLSLIRQLGDEGYKVHIFYLLVPSVDLALSRIRERVLEGGHDVPEAIVRRRFNRSITNFLLRYRPLADSWTLFDNSEAAPNVIAFQNRGELRIILAESYQALVDRYRKA